MRCTPGGNRHRNTFTGAERRNLEINEDRRDPDWPAVGERNTTDPAQRSALVWRKDRTSGVRQLGRAAAGQRVQIQGFIAKFFGSCPNEMALVVHAARIAPEDTKRV